MFGQMRKVQWVLDFTSENGQFTEEYQNIHGRKILKKHISEREKERNFLK